jgi:outer membrane protein OmpA-like peptidoglycan-associated protein
VEVLGPPEVVKQIRHDFAFLSVQAQISRNLSRGFKVLQGRDKARTGVWMADDPCVVVGGGGAWPEDPEERCLEGEHAGGDSADTGGPEIYVGGSCYCGHLEPASALPWLLLLAVRFRAWGLLLLLAWPWQAGAADVQLLRLVDGGTFTTIRADPGPAWASSVVAGASYAHMPAMAYADGERYPLISSVTTTSLSAGFNLGARVKLVGELPMHWLIRGAFTDLQTPGDVTVGLSISPTPEGATGHSSWSVQGVLPTGDGEQLLGGPGAALAAFSHERPLTGRLLGAGSAGVRLQTADVLPGVVLGPRLELKAGLAAQLRPVTLVLEGMGSMPLRATNTELATVPFELLASARKALSAGNALRLGAGAGVGRGLGSPSFRVLATFEAATSPVDTDADGYVDARDLCDKRPEDRDEHADWDGCPDPDNDDDGFLDAEDQCPDDPETFNELLDDDGCPDTTSRLVLRLSSPDPELESAQIRVAGQVAQLLADDTLQIELPPMVAAVEAQAEGHRPKMVELDLTAGGRFEVTLPLEPITWGDVRVRLQDPAGEPLVGTAHLGGQTEPVPAEGVLLTTWAGRGTLTVASEGYGPRVLDVVVPRDGELSVEVTLEPLQLWADGEEIQLREEIRFALDSARLLPQSELPLDTLARWLLDHPSIELFRIEGHADEPGSPRYNLELSQDRAEIVRDGLVARGVQPERLQALGSGEAGVPRDSDGLRRVTFLVVVWDDAELAPPPELAPLFAP